MLQGYHRIKNFFFIHVNFSVQESTQSERVLKVSNPSITLQVIDILNEQKDTLFICPCVIESRVIVCLYAEHELQVCLLVA
jgi:hypothetical protein